MDKIILGIALVLLSVVEMKAANVQIFTNEATFKSGLTSYSLYNFDAFSNGGSAGAGDIMNRQIAGIDFDNAVVCLGSYGGSYHSSPNVLLNYDFVNPIIFRFDQPVLAVGLYNASVVDAERFDIYDANNNLLASINLPSGSVNFGGFISDVGIAKGVVTPIAPTNGSIFIDDLIVSSVAVPEPGSLLLGIVSLLAILGYRRMF